MFTAVLTLLVLAAAPDAVHLDYEASVSFNEDGSVTESTRTCVIPLNGRGVRRYSSMTLSHRSGMEDIEILEASVGHWRGGRGSSEGTVSTGPHSILTATGRLESSLRETLITMPGVEVGDTVTLHVERRIRDLPLSRVYSYSFSPVMVDSVARSSFRLENPAGVRLYSSEPGELFLFTGVSPLPSHPLAAVDTRWISIATGTPETLSAEASIHIDLPWHGDCEELHRVIGSVGTDPGRLRSWMADNISYIGTDSGVWPGWSPRSPEETMEDHAGVCRDRAILLTWLLRKAGFEAYPALVSTRGETPSLVDARTFDHMITVYREEPESDWRLLDPTPVGIPEKAGFSFGLRGCTYLPLVPWGSPLLRVPAQGWNDTLSIGVEAALHGDSGVLEGRLTARSSGVPLELITTLYTRSSPETVKEMVRRFFGAVTCTSVSFEGDILTMEGTWQARVLEDRLLLPGLREISLAGTRAAAMLIPAPPDSVFMDATAVEILTMEITLPREHVILPEPVEIPGYSCSLGIHRGRLLLRETASVTNGSGDLTEMLLLRAGSAQRTVMLP